MCIRDRAYPINREAVHIVTCPIIVDGGIHPRNPERYSDAFDRDRDGIRNRFEFVQQQAGTDMGIHCLGEWVIDMTDIILKLFHVCRKPGLIPRKVADIRQVIMYQMGGDVGCPVF